MKIRRLFDALRARREARAFPADTVMGFPPIGVRAPADWRRSESCRLESLTHGLLCCRPKGHRSPWHAATDIDGIVVSAWLDGRDHG